MPFGINRRNASVAKAYPESNPRPRRRYVIPSRRYRGPGATPGATALTQKQHETIDAMKLQGMLPTHYALDKSGGVIVTVNHGDRGTEHMLIDKNGNYRPIRQASPSTNRMGFRQHYLKGFRVR